MKDKWVKIPVTGHSLDHSNRVRRWCKANNVDAHIVKHDADVWKKVDYTVWNVPDPKHRTLFLLKWLSN